MQTISNETHRIHYGARDCWPASGPVYGFLADDKSPRHSRGRSWLKWLVKTTDRPEEAKAGPISPIHY
jgi:hypothetical protein